MTMFKRPEDDPDYTDQVGERVDLAIAPDARVIAGDEAQRLAAQLGTGDERPQPNYSNDPDYTAEAGAGPANVLPPPAGGRGRSFLSYELAVEVSLADTLEWLAAQRGIRPEELAGEIVTHSLEMVREALAPRQNDRSAVLALADAVTRTIELGTPAEDLTRALERAQAIIIAQETIIGTE